MDCLRSFSININEGGTYSSGPSVILKQWGVVGNQPWAINITASSNYAIQGFKNIDLYGASVNGIVTTQIGSALSGVVVEDWDFGFFLDGQLPLIGGVATNSFWTLNDNNNQARQFALNKFSNEIKFASPIKSVKNIFFNDFKAQGQSSQTATTIALGFDLNFVFYYKFEGE
jgi:hypothetical protein